MLINLSDFELNNKVVAVATSGGSDSMALLHFLLSKSNEFNFTVKCINIEHGIRGKSSIDDSNFVKDYCEKNNIPLIFYKIDCITYANKNKLTIEESGRILRYKCFNEAIENGLCDKVATAHHKLDNVESVLLNIFRGSGIKGVAGINTSYKEKIIRPFLSVEKKEILDYIEKNNIPFITDESNFNLDYTRNYLRNEIIPKIKDIFPDVENSIYRLSQIAKKEDDYLDNLALKSVKIENNVAYFDIKTDDVILSRAIVITLKRLGVYKDWTKKHIDSVLSLKKLSNGAKISLPNRLQATKEYDKILISFFVKEEYLDLPFSICKFSFNKKTYEITKVDKNVDLKSGLFFDADKIPLSSRIRLKKQGDIFTKFGGGKKSLGDYLTDKKIPLREREKLPIIALDNIVYGIFGVAVSDLVKVTAETINIYQLKEV